MQMMDIFDTKQLHSIQSFEYIMHVNLLCVVGMLAISMCT